MDPFSNIPPSTFMLLIIDRAFIAAGTKESAAFLLVPTMTIVSVLSPTCSINKSGLMIENEQVIFVVYLFLERRSKLRSESSQAPVCIVGL